jgi:class 3 adenylate cyclase/tetratricopeptide (TPR) repeat protein
MSEGLPEGTLTLLFTDVEGSTDLTTRLGDEEAQKILRSHRQLVQRQVEQFGGQQIKGTGDGSMVAFTSARRAVECAIAIQRALRDRNEGYPREAVPVRIGLNSGEVIREEGPDGRGDLFGATVTAAARIAAKASGDQILVAETVKALLGAVKDVEFADRGRFRLKGFADRWRLYQVLWEREGDVSAPVLLKRTPFVGRQNEREELRRYMEQAVAGQGGLVLLSGEPGVGKSRLAEQSAAEAGEPFLALCGHCYEIESLPYAPFVEILDAATRGMDKLSLQAALGDAGPEVARMLPALRKLVPDTPAPLDLPPEQERHYLFNNVLDFLERASKDRPLLLVIEDLHWADDSTLLLLHHLAQRAARMRVVVIATYRDIELEGHYPLLRALEAFVSQRLARQISLKCLSPSSVETMLRALAGRPPPEQLLKLMLSETEGNPFFIEEVFKNLLEERKLVDESGNWRAEVIANELDVPEGVRLVIGRRLERLSDDCHRLLTAAAVIGYNFTFDVLTSVSEMDTNRVLDCIDEAERAHLIVSGEVDGRFVFSHELIRQTLLSGVSGARRQTLHLRVAEVMERAQSFAQQEMAADLSYHLSQAGDAADPRKRSRYLLLAGDRALSAAAFEEALRQYERALELKLEDDPRLHAELLYKRGFALRSLARWEEALGDWRQALAKYEALGDLEAVGQVSSDAARQLLWGGRYVEALEIALRGLSRLGRNVTPHRALLLGNAGLTLSVAGYYRAGGGMITAAVRLAEELGNDQLLARALVSKAAHHFSYGQSAEQAEAGHRAIELCKAGGDLWDLTNALWVTLATARTLDESAALHEELEPLATRLGNQGALFFAFRAMAHRDLMITGNIIEFEGFAKKDLEMCRKIGLLGLSQSHAYLGLAHFWLGRWDEASSDFATAAQVEEAGVWEGLDSSCLLRQKAYEGDRGGVLRILRAKPRPPPRMPLRRRLALARAFVRAARAADLKIPAIWQVLSPLRDRSIERRVYRAGVARSTGTTQMTVEAVEGLALLGISRAAFKLYPVVEEMIRSDGNIMPFHCDRLLETAAGISAAAGRRWDKAEEHYQTALQQAHDLPHRLEQPEVRRFYATMLLERNGPGDGAKAQELLSDAVAMYRELGMPKHVDMAQALLRG